MRYRKKFQIRNILGENAKYNIFGKREQSGYASSKSWLSVIYELSKTEFDFWLRPAFYKDILFYGGTGVDILQAKHNCSGWV